MTIICLSLFSDGLSTTTPTILFNLYALATNPEVQEKVFKEIESVVGKGGEKDISQEHINKMVYLKAFVKETFRLWPNGTEVSRFLEQDLVLSGYQVIKKRSDQSEPIIRHYPQVPSGTHVDLNPSVHFRDPNLFPDPDAHRPERWLRAEIKVTAGSEATTNKTSKATKTSHKRLELSESDVTSGIKIHPYLLTPFGHGTRMCAGRRSS